MIPPGRPTERHCRRQARSRRPWFQRVSWPARGLSALDPSTARSCRSSSPRSPPDPPRRPPRQQREAGSLPQRRLGASHSTSEAGGHSSRSLDRLPRFGGFSVQSQDAHTNATTNAAMRHPSAVRHSGPMNARRQSHAQATPAGIAATRGKCCTFISRSFGAETSAQPSRASTPTNSTGRPC